LFGARSAKAGGATITNVLKAMSAHEMIHIGAMFSLGIVGIWSLAAFGVGSKFADLTKNDEIVE